MANFLEKCLNIMYPNIKCVICGDDVNTEFLVCENCLKTLPLINGKICQKCGKPMKSEGDYCLFCKGNKFDFEIARAPFKYEEPINNLIFNFKYNNAKFSFKTLAKFMGDCYFSNNINADIIVPVPLFQKREKKRGYNQATLLAREISKIINVPLQDNIIKRTKDTPSQTKLSYQERQINLRNAFKIVNRNEIKNKSILLIDDVYTTGATAKSLSHVLKHAGASKIYVLTLATTEFHEEND